ncbi:MAG: Abi family protein [Pseudomonadota bacterium]
MTITNEALAEECLARIGYYRLSAYWYPFRSSTTSIDPLTGKRTTVIQDVFETGASFNDAMEFYVFDKQLRLLVMDALERIEVSIRTEIAFLMGQYDGWAHRKPQFLHGNFTTKPAWIGANMSRHAYWLSKVDEKCLKSKEDFAKHFKRKYTNDDMPIWVSVELWDFGTMSHFYSGMKVADRDAIAKRYGNLNWKVFETWIRNLNDVRNICAHHSRLLNRNMAAQPSWPKQQDEPDLSHAVTTKNGLTRFYASACILRKLLLSINPNSKWHDRFVNHMVSLPSIPKVTLQSAGFPINWETEAIWK